MSVGFLSAAVLPRLQQDVVGATSLCTQAFWLRLYPQEGLLWGKGPIRAFFILKMNKRALCEVNCVINRTDHSALLCMYTSYQLVGDNHMNTLTWKTCKNIDEFFRRQLMTDIIWICCILKLSLTCPSLLLREIILCNAKTRCWLKFISATCQGCSCFMSLETSRRTVKRFSVPLDPPCFQCKGKLMNYGSIKLIMLNKL